MDPLTPEERATMSEQVYAREAEVREVVDEVISGLREFRRQHSDASPAVVNALFFHGTVAKIKESSAKTALMHLIVREADRRDGLPEETS